MIVVKFFPGLYPERKITINLEALKLLPKGQTRQK